jgi:hypothetical protein
VLGKKPAKSYKNKSPSRVTSDNICENYSIFDISFSESTRLRMCQSAVERHHVGFLCWAKSPPNPKEKSFESHR